MKAVTKILAGSVAAAALAYAAPAAAQYYPGYGYGTGGVGQVVNQVVGGGYGNNGYGNNQQAAVNQCAAAVQQRLGGGYANNGYGYNGYPNGYAYNNNGYGGGGRVLGISRVEPRGGGGLTVRGVATSGHYGGYGYNNGQAPVDLTWRCKTDYRGFVAGIDISPAQRNYGYGNGYNYAPNGAVPYNNYDYSQYGYRRY
jgi:hypothetical protein